MTDWLVPVREGDDNPELRYALRSWVTNCGMGDGDRLVIVGYCPSWLTPDLFIPGNAHRTGPVNVYENIRNACASGLLGDRIIVANDDMFAVEPTDPATVYYRRPLIEHVRLLPSQATWWGSSLRLTLAYLRKHGVEVPLSYELHRPLPVDTVDMARILAAAWDGHGYPIQWRSAYGNLHGIGGERADDIKFLGRRGAFRGPWASTTDGAWRLGWGDTLSAMFPTASPWEVA